MISVSDELKEVALANARTPLGKLAMYVGDNTTPLEFSSSQLQSFTVTRSAGTSDEFTLGATVASQLDMTIKTSELPALVHNNRVIPYMGYIVNGEEEWVKLGEYYIDDSESSTSGIYTSLSAYDVLASSTLNQQFDGWNSEISGINTQDKLKYINTSLGGNVIDVESFPDLPVKRVTSLEDAAYEFTLPAESSIRDCISLIAAICGGNAMTNSDGKIAFYALQSVPSCALSTNSYKNSGITLDTREQSVITHVSTTFEEEDVECPPVDERFTGGTGLSFNDEIFSYSGESALFGALNVIWEQLIGNNKHSVSSTGDIAYIKYQPFTLKCKGIPFLEPMDLITAEVYTDFPNKVVRELSPITVKHSYDGAISTELQTAASTTNTAATVGSKSTLSVESVYDSVQPAMTYVKELLASSIKASDITTDHLDVRGLISADEAQIQNLKAKFAQIDFANITDVNATNLVAKSAYITQLEVAEGTFTEKLSSVAIDAGSITTGTILAKNILLEGDDGIIYKLNAKNYTDAQLLAMTAEELNALKNKIDGESIIANSITADKIKVTDLNAFGATIGGLEIFDGGLRTSGNSLGGNGVYLDKNGNFSVGNANAGIVLNVSTPGEESFSLNVTTVQAKEDVQMGHYIWDVRNYTASGDANERLSLKWVGA